LSAPGEREAGTEAVCAAVPVLHIAAVGARATVRRHASPEIPKRRSALCRSRLPRAAQRHVPADGIEREGSCAAGSDEALDLRADPPA